MNQPGPEKSKISLAELRYFLRELAHSLLHLGLLLVAAGKWDWLNAWVCFGLDLSYQGINAAVLKKYNPGLPAKRSRLIQKGTKPFDKVFILLYLPLAISISIVSGLDAVRFGWSQMPGFINLVGVAIFLAACAFGLWAMSVNRHFEFTVIVKTDGSQQVCATGPYQYLRHPGYAAAIVGSISYPLILGSWWGLALSSLLIALFVARTIKEDRALIEELPGYREYAAKVRSRLAPFVW